MALQLQFVETAAAVKENYVLLNIFDNDVDIHSRRTFQACKSNSNIRKELGYKNIIGIQNSFTRHAHCTEVVVVSEMQFLSTKGKR